MGKDTVYLFEGDGEADIEVHLIELFGLDYSEYLEHGKKILTKDIINDRLELVLQELGLHHKGVKIGVSKACYLHYLGYFILNTGANLPDDLKQKIIESTKLDVDGITWSSQKLEEERKILLEDLRDKIINYKEGEITQLIEFGGNPLKIPDIVIDWEKIKTLIEKGCSFEQIIKLLDIYYPVKITPELIFENINYHWPLTSVYGKNFKKIRERFLRPLLEKYFKEGVKTPEEMNQKFVSPENPKGIPIDEIIILINQVFHVNSWEEAVIKFQKRPIFNNQNFPTEINLKWWHRILSYIKKVKPLSLKQIIDDGFVKDLSYEEFRNKFITFWALRDVLNIDLDIDNNKLNKIILRLLNNIN